MAKITTLFEDSAKTEALYPRTKVSAISDGNNTSLEELLDDLVLTAGRGIKIDNKEISTEYDDFSTGFDINNVTYDYMGYVPTATNGPANYTSGTLLSVASESGANTMQIFHHYNSDRFYVRYYRSAGSGWSDWNKILQIPVDSLWENVAGSNNSFAAQTISLDLSQYMYVVVVFRVVTSSAASVTCIARPTGIMQMGIGFMNVEAEASKRTFTPSSSGIQFYAGRKGTTDDNTRMVPRYIYGIK